MTQTMMNDLKKHKDFSSYHAFLERALNWKQQRLKTAKADPPSHGKTWYSYDTLSNLWHIEKLIAQTPKDIKHLCDIKHVADIGAADGDIAYFLESEDMKVDLIDWPATNWNGLDGARALNDRLGYGRVQIHEVDLDSQFKLPSKHYDLIFFLGILYHLKNPFYIMETLAKHSKYCFLSTRIARTTSDHNLELESAPLAYLLHPQECNNDPTNYWIFSAPGLIRLVERAGWNIRANYRVGDTKRSDPSSQEHDERMFLYLESRMQSDNAPSVL